MSDEKVSAGKLTPDQWRRLEMLLPSLVRMATALSGTQHDGEDLVQSAIVQSIPVLSGIVSPERYLRKVIVNRWTDNLRRKRVVNEVPTLAQDIPDIGFAPDPVDLVVSRESVNRILGQLDPASRAIVVLRYVVGLNSREIAAVVGGSAGAVRRQLHINMNLLRQTIEEEK